MRDTPSIFATRLKTARLTKGLTQEQLGVMAGIDEFSASTRMNRYEKGIHEPHLDIVQKIASVLDLPSAYFYCKDDIDAEILSLIYHLSHEEKHKLLNALKIQSQDESQNSRLSE